MDNMIKSPISVNLPTQDFTLKNAITIHGKQEDVKTEVADKKQGIIVNVSEQSQQKLTEEKKKLGQELAGQLRSDKAKEEEELKEAEKDPIEKLIAQLKERIKEVKEQLSQLEGDESEAAEMQKEMLNEQLIELNMQLLAAYEKKLSAAKANGAV